MADDEDLVSDPPVVPKPRHDGWWVLGIVGRSLITIGLLMFAFVAYQLWGTGIQTAREQNRLRSEFDQLLETAVPVTAVPQPTTQAPVTTDTATSDPGTSDPATTSTTTPPVTTIPAAAISPPPEGDPVARLQIPAMDINDKIVIEGVSPTDLQDGPGHFPETPLPGQLGNAAIAGHRTTHGQPFRHIDRLVPGDEIIVTTLAGRYVYVVTGTTIVAPSAYAEVIPTVDPDTATLTLTSCHPVTTASKRIVVFAELDVERSSPVTLASPSVDAGTDDGSEPGSGSTLPGDDAPDQTVSTLPSTTDVSSTEPASTEPGTTDSTPANTATGSPTITQPPTDTTAEPPPESADVFENRWFSDPDAYPHVILWGLLLASVAIAAYAFGRRIGRTWVGALAGFVPFVVVLYFFFENVNRLLPPNL